MAGTLTIGLTGGIGSGKSTVEHMFVELGVPVLDADQAARAVVAPGSPALAEIAAAFGADMLLADGNLDRRKMRERVFGNDTERRRLEAITHPHIRRRMTDWKAEQTTPYCMLSVAILIEARMHSLVDRILVVDVPEDVQIARVCQRDGINDVLARRMLAAQLPRAERLEAADDVLCNTMALEIIRECVGTLHRFYLDLASSGRQKAPGLRLPQSAF